MFDGTSFSATGQRLTLATAFGGDAARGSTESADRQQAASGSADPFGPSVLLPDAVRAVEKTEAAGSAAGGPVPARDASEASAETGSTEASNAAEEGDESNSVYRLSDEEEAYVDELAGRDAEVRAHENAHASAGGQYAGAPTYSYVTGPDGKQYATGGSVSIDTSPINGNPQATITKMATVIRAALAPAEPSPADRNVAQQAQRQMATAQVELARQFAGGAPEEDGGEPSSDQAAASADATLRDAIRAYQRGAGS